MTIKEKYIVSSIDKAQTYDWLLHKHYAKRIPSISYSFGLFTNKKLNGILTIGKPASPALCDGICGKHNTGFVYELNRLCINDDLEKNTLSFFVGQCLKMLPNIILVSYADTKMNHHGYIYQATNWIYTGLSEKRTDRIDERKLNKHGRHNKTGILKDRPRKHRYVYFIGNRKQIKTWMKELNYKTEPYPKGNNKKYDASFTPQVQTVLFSFLLLILALSSCSPKYDVVQQLGPNRYHLQGVKHKDVIILITDKDLHEGQVVKWKEVKK